MHWFRADRRSRWQVDILRRISARTWQTANSDEPANDGAWQNFRLDVSLPESGYYEIWARATDDEDEMQPFAIAWNPKGYLNNSMHKVAVRSS